MKIASLAGAPAIALLLLGAAVAEDTPAGEIDAAVMEQGASIYARDCRVCHGAEGGGGAGVPLAANGSLENTERTVRQITRGGSFMPAFRSLNDGDLAALVTYIRNSFGNSFGAVTEEEVAAHR